MTDPVIEKPDEKQRPQSRIRAGIDRFLGGTHDHFLCALPERTGIFSTFLLRLFYKGVRVEEDQTRTLREVRDRGYVIYVTKYKNDFDILFYYTRYRDENLPFPTFGFDYKFLWLQPFRRMFRIFVSHLDTFFRRFSTNDPYTGGFFRKEILAGRSGLLSLVEKRGFHRRFVRSHTDPLQFLIELQSELQKPVFLVPQIIFFSTKPQKSIPSIVDILFGGEENPKRIRRLAALFKNPGKVFVEVVEPIDLQAFMSLPESQEMTTEQLSRHLRTRLLEQINRHRQSIIGPVLKTREELRQGILTNEELQEFMARYAEKRETPLFKVQKEAEGYLDEIAARYRAGIVRACSITVRWILDLMYEGVITNREMLTKIKAMALKGPVILIPCHKSHVDYLIISYFLYTNHFSIPLIAAGKNLSFWPMGPIFRSGNAFFIRRTFRGAILYSRVFAQYIHTMLSEGHNIEFFIEGGRSRTGKLLMPKLGLLSMLVNACREGACKDLVFAPVYVGYDEILEENAYVHEIEGGKKEPENFWQVLKARKFLKKRYGKIYLKFSTPFTMSDLLAHEKKTLHELTSKQQNMLIRDIGFRVLNAIDEITVVTPHALVASALLNCSQRRFTREHLLDHVETYLSHLFTQSVTLTDTLQIDPATAMENALASFIQRKCVEVSKDARDTPDSLVEYSVNPSKRTLLDFYKNNCISFFVPAATSALAILDNDAFQFTTANLNDRYRFIRDLFANEFAYSVDKEPEFFLRKSIKAFIDDAILIPHPTLPDTYNVTSLGFRKLNLYARFLKPFLESYLITLKCFEKHPRKALEAKDRQKKVQQMGKNMFKNHEVVLPEALSDLNYKNAMNLFVSRGIKGEEDAENIQPHVQAIKKYLTYL